MSLVAMIVGMLCFVYVVTKPLRMIQQLRKEFEEALDDYDVIPDVKVHRLKPNAKLPSYARLGDAGADICACEDSIVYPMEWKVVDCGFAMELPEGWEAQIRSRSGQARKAGVVVLNSPGTIDSGYRGSNGVLLINFGAKPFEVKAGERIAQMVIARAPQARFIEEDELAESDRGKGGWGHTGR